MDAPPAQPVRQHARISRVIFVGVFSGTDNPDDPPTDRLAGHPPTYEVPGGQVALIDYQGGHLLVVQALPDGRMRRWFNVPCMIEHEAPSGLVLPNRPV
jgi:hypothetical protein